MPAPDERRTVAFRGSILHFLRDPGPDGDAAGAYEYHEDGLLVVEAGRVARVGEARVLRPALPANVPVTDYSGKLLLPGFIDAHVHYTQTDVVASPGEQLLGWLERYVLPAEGRFGDREYAAEVAGFFVEELLRNGTTTALVFASVFPSSVDAIFAAAQGKGMRLIAGKVMMDRNCPEYVRDDAEGSYRDSQALIERWHARDRLLYAVTPRFAPTSTARQLELAGRLCAERPDVYLHSHVAENRREVAWVAELFPGHRSYLDVYDRHGLVRPRSVYAHGIHLDDADRARLANAGAALAFCPGSNLFLGSGLFDLEAARRQGVRVGVGTDVGGGPTFSLLRTLADAYKVTQLAGQRLSPLRAFYLVTLGGAEALHLHDRLGNFLPGKEADFVVLDPASTPLLARRAALAADLAEKLFVLMMLGDDRAVAATHLLGEPAHERDRAATPPAAAGAPRARGRAGHAGPPSGQGGLTLAAVSRMGRVAFARALGGIFEASPWVAARTRSARPFATVTDLHRAMVATVRSASEGERLALLRSHPDLAGQAARAGSVTARSTREQAGAGLTALTDEEYARFDRLNAAYRERFDFPFTICVRNHTTASILDAFERRLGHARAAEIETALTEVFEIARHRLADLFRGAARSGPGDAGAGPGGS